VIGWEGRVLLRHYLAEGLSKTEIARRLDISRKTVSRWVRSGELDRDLDEPVCYKSRPPVARKLDPYQAIIATRLEAYPKLSSVRLLEEIRAAGYVGGYTQLKQHVRRIRPRPPEEPLIRFETAPGRQAQVDFADFKFDWGKRYALMVVLGYSRLLWVRFFLARYALQARTLKSQCAAKRMNSAFVTSFSPFIRPSFVMTDFIWSNSSSCGTPPKKLNASSRPSSSACMSLRGKKRTQSSLE